MAPLAVRAPPLTLRRVARAIGPRELSACRRRRGPKGPKEGSRRPARHGPLVASQMRAGPAPSQGQRISCVALMHVRWAARPGAPRARL